MNILPPTGDHLGCGYEVLSWQGDARKELKIIVLKSGRQKISLL